MKENKIAEKIHHYYDIKMNCQLLRKAIDSNFVKDEKNFVEEFKLGIGKNKSENDKKGFIQEYVCEKIIVNKDYKLLIQTFGKKTGFDGIYQKNNKMYFYESKYLENGTLNSLLSKSNKRIINTNKSGGRYGEIYDSKVIGKFKDENELELIEKWLESAKYSQKIDIDKCRRIHGLGTKKNILSKSYEGTDELKKYERVFLFQYEK